MKLKVVINPVGVGLRLSQNAMDQIAFAKGWGITNGKVDHPEYASEYCWFTHVDGSRVDHEAFRYDPLLVNMVEDGLAVQHLKIVEIPEHVKHWFIRATERYGDARDFDELFGGGREIVAEIPEHPQFIGY